MYLTLLYGWDGQEEQIPHATSEATISVAVEMELSETQATTPLLSEEQTLAVESEEV